MPRAAQVFGTQGAAPRELIVIAPGVISVGVLRDLTAAYEKDTGTKITILDMDSKPKVVKALELSGASNVLFRRNSVTGTVEAVAWQGDIALNSDLHTN